MNKKERAHFILKTLNEFFPHPTIPLQHTDSFTLLIAVLLSAQSTDLRVNKITPFLFLKASCPEDMLKLSISEIEEMIRSCGLSKRKARAIWQLSSILVRDYKGKVPKSFKSLESLPGVGHKTASVVMAQAFAHPAFPVDTHIHRCAKRWGLSSGKNVEQTERDLKRSFSRSHWNTLHLQMIYFARKYCPARGHSEEKCPICKELLQEI